MNMNNILAVVQRPQTTSDNLNIIIVVAIIVVIVLVISTVLSNKK